jgi:subtilase family serine protease
MFQPLPVSLPDNATLSALDPGEQIPFVITVQRPESLKDFVDTVISGQNQYLSREEFNTRFSATDEDIAAVVNYATSNGLTVISTHAPSAHIELAGSAGTINSLFGITLQNVTTPNGTFRSWTGDVEVSPDVNNIIEHIAGLDTLPPYTKKLSEFSITNSTPAGLQAITPIQAATAYQFPSSSAAGQCIGIIEYGGGYTQQNLTSSFSAIGLTNPTTVDVSVGGYTNTPDNNIYGYCPEVMLDIFCAGAVAPSATLAVYFGNINFLNAGPTWGAALNAAIHDSVNNPSVLSVSYGAGEISYFWGPTAISYVDNILMQSVALGITVCVSSGDQGSIWSGDGGTTPDTEYPGSSPYVLCIGGTTLELNTDNTIYSEVTWGTYSTPPGGSGTGGGISQYDNSLPSWQSGLTYTPYTYPTGAGSATSLTSRGVPDVSANADPSSGYQFYWGTGNSFAQYGGTSAAAPVWAGFIARLNAITGTRLGFANTLFYSNPNVFRDITVGNNANYINNGYAATPGWDACTGLGTPIGTAILGLLTGGGGGGGESSDDTLSNLTLSIGGLSYTGATSYSLSVSNDVTSLTVTPTVNESHATVTVNGTPVTSGLPSGTINLSVGNNTIIVAVTAQNSATLTYIITINRLGVSLSSDDTLSNLTISSGNLTYTGATSYNVSVEWNVSSVIVTPTVNESHATVTVNGNAVLSGQPSGSINLNHGNNTVTIVVTAQDSSTKTYTIIVNRAPVSNDATLNSLTISSGTLSPGFNSNTISYTDSVANNVLSVTVTPLANNPTSTIKVNGVSVATGTASQTIVLTPGPNTITIIVTAGDGTTVKTYTITVTRAYSSDATLSNLIISSGTLIPTFNSSTTSYTGTVNVSSITVTPTVNESHATVTVNGTSVLSGSISKTIVLGIGINTIIVVVTAQDSTTKTYTIALTRLTSNDATLSNILVPSYGLLSPAFNSLTPRYTIIIPNNYSSVIFSVLSTQPDSTIKINGNTVVSGSPFGVYPIPVGSQSVTVVVTAPDRVTTKTYSLTITREGGGNNDAKLNGLFVSAGTLVPLFSGNVHSYSDTVNNEIESITVTPIQNDLNALTTVNGNITSNNQPSTPISLSTGTTSIMVVIRSLDLTTTNTYKISVFREPPNVQTTKYTQIYATPFLSENSRQLYHTFITNTNIFPTKVLYKQTDPSFGLQYDIRVYLEYAIQELNYSQYNIGTIRKQQLLFGVIKVLSTALYDMVYVTVVDNTNILSTLRTSLENMQVSNTATVAVNKDFANIVPDQNFVTLCYTQPGQGNYVRSRILSSNFNFNQLNFTIDRVIIASTLDDGLPKYVFLS